jgi:CBS domain-containing protein
MLSILVPLVLVSLKWRQAVSIKSICKIDVVTVEKGATLSAVSQLMHKKHVGSVIVTEAFNGKMLPCGIITDRDIALVLGSAPKPQEVRVENIMQSQPITAEVGDGILEVVVKMKDNGIKRLPVVDSDGSLFGIVCADDLTCLLAEELSSLAKISLSQIRREKGLKMPVEKHVQI